MVTTRSSSAAAAASSPGHPSDPPPIDALSKSKTISHMNKDHHADMSAILRHFNALPAPAAAGPEMLDMDLRTMTIRSASGTHTVRLAPAMESWDDRRARLVDMTLEARRALGLDDDGDGGAAAAAAAAAGASSTPADTGFAPPRGLDWIAFGGLALYWTSAALVYAGAVERGSLAGQVLEAVHFPSGAEGLVRVVKAIFVPVVVIHVVEAAWLDRSRLQPSGVRRGSVDWCLWTGSAFLEGFPAFRRWDAVVRGGKGAKKAQ